MVSLWKHYNNAFARYETNFPLAFPWNREEKEDVPRYILGGDGYWYDPAAKDSGKALLSCTGDLMCEPTMTTDNRYGDAYFFHPLFQYVRPLLKGSDFVVGNLETTLTDCTPYAGEYHRIAKNYHCNGPKCYLDALRYAGFDALINANNHDCDSGVTGLMDTLDALDESGFPHTGTFRSPEEERVIFVRINGIRVAILSFANRFNGLDANLTQEGIDALLSPFSKEKAAAQVAYARSRGAEFVLSYIHWGKGYDLVPSEQQLKILAELKDSGVDYIVGSHTHCLQHHAVVTASDGRAIPVMFSMGNFVTNEEKELCKHTGILQLILRRGEAGISVEEFFVPCYVFDRYGTGCYPVVPADSRYNGGVDDEKMHAVRAYVRERLGEDLPQLPACTVTLEDLCQAMGTVLPEGLTNRPVTTLSVSIEVTRPGALYFSPEQETKASLRDLRQARPAAVVTREPLEDLPCILCPDVEGAYLAACRLVKSRVASSAKTVLVTGGAGKTVTRCMIAQVLKEDFAVYTVPDGHRIPMAPWQNLHPYHELCIQELRPGDPMGVATQVSAIAPEILVVTGTMAGLNEMIQALPTGALLLWNGDDKVLATEMERLPGHIRAERYSAKDAPLCLGQPFSEQIPCAAAAFAVGRALGMEEGKTRDAIAAYRIAGLHQNVVTVDGVTLVLNIACSSEASAQSALDALAKQPGEKIAVFGAFSDDTGASLAMAKAALQKGVKHAIVFGEAAAEGVQSVTTERDLEKAVLEHLCPGDALLLCGGREAQLNTTLRRLFGLTDGWISDTW